MIRLIYLMLITLISTTSLADQGTQLIAYINSYHPGYEWTDKGFSSFKAGLKNTNYEIHVHYMDTKRNKEKEQLVSAAHLAHNFIKNLKPNLIIAAEDNASKLVIQPNYLNHPTPVIFIGVNVNASQYGYPATNVTGLIEMDRIENLINVMRHYFKKEKVGMIFSKTTTSTKKYNYFKQLNLNGFEAVQVNNENEWRKSLSRFNEDKDFIALDTISGIKNLNHETAKNHIINYVRQPVVTISATSRSLAHIGYINVPEEHGNWAAQAALKILGGKSPLQIPIETSRFYKMFINQSLIDSMNIEIPESLYKLKHETFN